MPTSQGRLLYRTVRNYELIKPAYVEVMKANFNWRMVHAKDSVVIAGQERLIGWWRDSYQEEQKLRQSSNREVQLWRAKARRRGVIIGVGVALPVAYGAYQILK